MSHESNGLHLNFTQTALVQTRQITNAIGDFCSSTLQPDVNLFSDEWGSLSPDDSQSTTASQLVPLFYL